VQHREIQADGESFRQDGLARTRRPAYQDGQWWSIRISGTETQRADCLSPTTPVERDLPWA
jgi:hypothetical protein